jgi:protein transport protein SEC31
VPALAFNPHLESSHLLGTGGADSEVYVINLERPDQPNCFIPAPPPNNTSHHSAAITKLSWNMKIPHILASGSQNGTTYIWDLKQKKAW